MAKLIELVEQVRAEVAPDPIGIDPLAAAVTEDQTIVTGTAGALGT